ncbi:MAG: hypothetical protein R3236_09260 [Phycisphaeraceae bacterium]|nr:hypothetical protein [Phycisphaeraceae bacterium]
MNEPVVDNELLNRPMRVREMLKTFGEQRYGLLETVLRQEPWAETYGPLLNEREQLLAGGDRKILDQNVPDELSRQLAEVSDIEYGLEEAQGNVMLLRELGSSDVYAQDPDAIDRLTALQGLERFGGGVICRLHEVGSCYVPGEEKS